MNKNSKALVIGAGPSGATVARTLAESGWKVDVFESRGHIAGNCYDELDENGVLIHKYGPHYFRSSNPDLIEWLSKFTSWIPGKYYVRAEVGNKLVPLPISLSSMTTLKGEFFDVDRFESYLKKNRVDIPNPLNAEEQCLSLVGKELYEIFLKIIHLSSGELKLMNYLHRSQEGYL